MFGYEYNAERKTFEIVIHLFNFCDLSTDSIIHRRAKSAEVWLFFGFAPGGLRTLPLSPQSNDGKGHLMGQGTAERKKTPPYEPTPLIHLRFGGLRNKI